MKQTRYIIQKIKFINKTIWFVRDTQSMNDTGTSLVVKRFYYKKDAMVFIKTLGV